VDAANNALTGLPVTGEIYTIDRTAPTVLSIDRVGASSTVKSGPLAWTVTFSEPVGGVTTNNFTLATSSSGGTAPSIPSATASAVAPSATWTVAVATTGTTGTNTGSIGLNLSSTGAIQDAATNGLSATLPVVGQSYTYDTTVPTVTINQAAGQPDPTNTSPINYTVVFSETVTGFTAGNVTISGTAGGTKSATVTGSGTTYNVAIGGATGNGTVTAAVAASAAQDAAGNNSAASTSTDNTVTLDTAAPTVVSINRVATSPTNASSVSWTGTVNGDVTRVDATGKFPE